MLRYYEEQDLLHPERTANGYRSYGEATVYRVQQIRGLLDSGLTTEIIRNILPFLARPETRPEPESETAGKPETESVSEPGGIHLHPDCLTDEMAAQLRG